MKRKYIFLSVILVLSAVVFKELPAQIVSKVTGGRWNNPSTWQGGTIPSAGDYVYLVGPVQLNINTACAGLTIHETGSLTNYGSSHTLQVNGNLVNDGMLQNQSVNLYLNVTGNLEFRGETSNSVINLNGAGNQSIFVLEGAVIAVENLSVLSGNVSALSDLYFYNTQIDFNNHHLTMQPGSVLSLTGSGSSNKIVKELNLVGQGCLLIAKNNYNFENFTASDVTIEGVLNIQSNGVSFFGETVLMDTIQNWGPSHTFSISGNLTNYGEILNHHNNLTAEISGNIANYGGINNHALHFTGSTVQQIFQGAGGYFNLDHLEYHGSASLELLSDVTIYNARVDLNNATVNLTDHTRLSYLNNNDSDFFRNAVLAANEGVEFLLRGGFVQNIQGQNLYLRGLFRVGDNYSNFTNCTLLDTLSNFGSSHSLAFHGSFTNVGRIFDQHNQLMVYCTGDVFQYGIWENQYTYLTGTQKQELTFSPDNILSGSRFEAGINSDTLIVNSDINFYNTQVYFNDVNIMMPDGALLSHGGYGKSLSNLRLHGQNIRLFMYEGSYLSNAHFFDRVVLEEEVRIGDNNCVFYQGAENTGLLGNQGSSHYLSIAGTFTNSGNVENIHNSFSLRLYGDFVNRGSIEIWEIKFLGGENQNIRMIDDNMINSVTVLDAELGGNNYQWHKNDVPIPGQTGTRLTFNPVTYNENGYYYCTSTEGASRLFSVEEQLFADFSSDAPEVGTAPQEVMFEGMVSGGFQPYSYLWDFGDGNTSTDESPTYVYDSPGTYTVSLTISDAYTQTGITKKNYIFICEPPQAGFSTESLCLGETAHFYDLSENLVMEDSLELRYAATLIDFSSEWDPENWGAIQVLGEPDVYPFYGDSSNAWAPLTPNGPREWIELGFDGAKSISAIWIYETLQPGTVDSVYAFNPETSQWEMLWSGSAHPAPPEARIYKIDFPETSFPVDQIRIAMNTGSVSYWNEIDAVALVSDIGDFPSAHTVYNWDVENDGIVDYTEKGSISHTYDEPGIYEVKLQVMNYGVCVDEMIQTIGVNNEPGFTEHPQDVLTCETGQAVFSALAEAPGDFEITYQWFGPDGEISGATEAALLLESVLIADTGGYYAEAINPCGSALSDVAYLSVQLNPEAYAGSGYTICENETFEPEGPAANNCSAILWETEGTGTFDDQQNLTPLYYPGHEDAVDGAVTLSLTAFPVSPCQIPATSFVEVTVLQSPYFEIQPQDLFVPTGSDAIFETEVSGEPPITLQWYGPQGILEGETGSQLMIPKVNFLSGGEFYCEAENSCELRVSDVVSLEVIPGPDSQDILVKEGWNGFSTCLWLNDPTTEMLMEPYIDDLTIIYNNQDAMFWPDLEINTLPYVDNHSGYIMKVTETITISLNGSYEADRTVNLAEGWSLLPVISHCVVDLAVFVEPAQDEIQLIKEIGGWRVYWPDMGINTLQVLMPGVAYFILTQNQLMLSYPECQEYKNQNKNKAMTQNQLNTPDDYTWGFNKTTASNHLIAITHGIIDNTGMAENGVIGVFDLHGKCFGFGKIEKNKNVLITAWGNDIFTDEKDGFEVGQQMYFRYYNPESEVEQALDPDFEEDSDKNLFIPNGLSVVRSVGLLAGTNSPGGHKQKVKIYPNPAHARIYVSGIEDEAGIGIFDQHGKKVFSATIRQHQPVSLAGINPGVYYVQIAFDDECITTQLIIVH